jgi:4-amino-4-deoxy-L-arabinose transferase-like glycosyltransferase
MTTSEQAEAVEEQATFTEELMGKELVNVKGLEWFREWPLELRSTFVAVMMGAVIFIPYLGAVGLWDCWETHYGEVAREMIQRNDYVHPYWENAYFFSKPVFTMWMMAVGMQAARGGAVGAMVLGGVLLLLGAGLFFGRGKARWLDVVNRHYVEFVGVLLGVLGVGLLVLGVIGLTVSVDFKFADIPGGDGALPLFTEWGFRLPSALFSIVAVGLTTFAMTRLVNARAGLATAFILCTMPLYFLLTRQAVTDPPFVSALMSGVACVLVGWFDSKTKHRSEWWYAGYFFFGIATLSKGLLGFGIPMVIGFLVLMIGVVTLSDVKAAAVWCVQQAKKPAMVKVLLVGAGMTASAAVLAYVLGTQWQTTFMAPQFNPQRPPPLLAAHWLAIMWGSLAFWISLTVSARWVPAVESGERRPKLIETLFHARLGTGILVFLAVCLPWYYVMFTFPNVDDESKLFWYRFLIHDHFARLGAGVYTSTPGGTFIYFIEQGAYGMFPWVVLLPGAVVMIGKVRLSRANSVDMVSLVAALWFAVAWGLVGLSATKFHHYVFPMLPPLAILMGIFVDRVWREGIDKHLMVLLFGLPLFILVGKDLAANPKNFTDLFVFNYDRPYPSFLTEQLATNNMRVKDVMGSLFTLFGVATALFAVMRAKFWTFASAATGALALALWFNWSHWVDLSHHWTQRDQFWRYYSQRKPGEPIAAFAMNWRGETFYSRNEVKQLKDNYAQQMYAYSQLPGRKWALVEHSRLGILKSAVGPNKTVTLIDKDLNNKFVLVTVD